MTTRKTHPAPPPASPRCHRPRHARLRNAGSPAARPPLGFTLVETLVTVAVIGLLASLLLPAIQGARESARRTQCGNNLRQLGLAMQSFEAMHRYFPTSSTGDGTHHWVAQILPHMDENPLATSYHYDKSAFDVANREAVQTVLPFMHCPSNPIAPVPEPKFRLPSASAPEGWGSFGVCYAGNGGVSHQLWKAPASVSYPRPDDLAGMFLPAADKKRRILDVVDGTATSVMFVESSGRPQVWHRHHGYKPGSGSITSSGIQNYVSTCSWASGNVFVVRGFTYHKAFLDVHSRWQQPGPTLVNASNQFGIFAFHPGGANFAMADGSIHFIDEDVDTDPMAQMLTIAGREIVKR